MYRSTWLCLVALAGMAGMWASMQALSVAGALAIVVGIALVVACIGLDAVRNGERSPWRRAGRLGVAWGAGLVATGGLVAWLGMSGVAIVMVLVGMSPTILTTARGRHRTRRAGDDGLSHRADNSSSPRDAVRRDHPTGADGRPSLRTELSHLRSHWMEQPPHDMDDPALCMAWRASYVTLQRPLALPLRLEIVQRRQELMDELEQRNPRGFAAWLASGARAAGDPRRYITQPPRPADHGDPPEEDH